MIDGIRFQSAKEARRYGELKLLQKAGKISDLLLQVRFPLLVNNIKVGTYVCDFDYRENGLRITEDVKGVRTSTYRLKAALMLACYGIKIKET